MLNKLAILTTAFVLALSAAAFASPIDRDSGPQDGGSEVAADRSDLVGSDQEEQQFVLYLGPTQQTVIPQPEADDRRVN